MAEFGKLLRRLREAADITMGQVARHLGVSTPYLSNVEVGHRPPLSMERIRVVAEFLGLTKVDEERLIAQAAEERQFFEISTEGLGPRHMKLGAALSRGLSEIPEDGVDELEEILRRYGYDA